MGERYDRLKAEQLLKRKSELCRKWAALEREYNMARREGISHENRAQINKLRQAIRNRNFRESSAGKRSRRLYSQRLKLKAQGTARAVGEPNNWLLYHDHRISSRRSYIKKRILGHLEKEPAPQKPVAPDGLGRKHNPLPWNLAGIKSEPHGHCSNSVHKALSDVSNQDLEWKKYREDVEDWERKYALWSAQRTPEHLSLLLEEGMQRWRAGVRARSKATQDHAKLSQSQNLGGGCWATVMAKTFSKGAQRKPDGTLKISILREG